MKAAATKQVHKREFYCSTCDPKGEQASMDVKQYKAHMIEIHKLTEFKGQKRGIMFLDGDFYSNTYELTFQSPAGEVKGTEVATGPKERGCW